MPQNTSVTIVWRNTSFTMRNTMTAQTARTRLSLCHRITLDSVAHRWVPARTFTVHQCLHGGRPWGPRHSPRDTTPTTRPRLSRHALVTNSFLHPHPTSCLFRRAASHMTIGEIRQRLKKTTDNIIKSQACEKHFHTRFV